MPKIRGEMGGPAEQAFGQVIREERLSQGLSQEKLAERSGCDRGYIGLLERGVNSPSLSMLFQISIALGLPPSDLLLRLQERLTVPRTETGTPAADDTGA